MNMEDLEGKTQAELLTLAKEKGIGEAESRDKEDLVMQLIKADIEQEGHVFCRGILDIMSDGYGFLRQDTLLPNQADVYVSPSQIRRFGLRNGDMVVGQGRPPKSN
ncbi:MAG: transcription termination factor Rho, partial [Dehalococcoidales bacterium]